MTPRSELGEGLGAAGRRRVLVGGLAAGLLAQGRWAVAEEEALESSVKAAYLYKFLAYVEWPAASFASADAPQVIGVLGADDVLAELQRLVVGRQVNGHPLAARRVALGEPVESLHVLYVGRAARPSAVVPTLLGRPILVVTDAAGALADGSALNFVQVRGRVRFEASVPAAERGGLKLSARLLAVAERVVTP